MLARNQVVLQGPELLDLAKEDGEEARLLLVHEGDRIALVLVQELEHGRDIRRGVERQVVLDGDGQDMRLPEFFRSAGKERQPLPTGLLGL